MKALILETSTQKSFLLLAKEGIPVKSKLLLGGPELSRTLAKEASMLLENEPVDFLLVGQGPGSYTGIRVGAALAKGLSFGWNIPLYGFCSLKAFAPNEDGPFTVLVDAKMGGVYALSGKRRGDQIDTDLPRLIRLHELEPLLQNNQTIVSPTPTELMKRLPHLTPKEASPSFSSLAAWAFLPEFQTPLELTYLSPFI
ncbi:MAG TPA: tRNA (adenosine(37)-N6)-threonylcarbamoyltransferase complex dimerization subunit type 1 TsaB [Parachlamydiales bacterium]|nr:tRNA (adenosine(37)-N6)-threonylcarbamoyltransferase complex dimerization subunit type 1 TsaB [Parachlamydiales bacterium]